MHYVTPLRTDQRPLAFDSLNKNTFLWKSMPNSIPRLHNSEMCREKCKHFLGFSFRDLPFYNVIPEYSHYLIYRNGLHKHNLMTVFVLFFANFVFKAKMFTENVHKVKCGQMWPQFVNLFQELCCYNVINGWYSQHIATFTHLFSKFQLFPPEPKSPDRIHPEL